jgi:hypothetical protein
MAKQLTYGQRVTVCDKTHASYGRTGQYEGEITADALRVRFPGGVVVAGPDQLIATPEHPVCTGRRIKRAGVKAPRVHFEQPLPACYVKDYGKTALEMAVDAFVDATDDASAEEVHRLCGEMMQAQRAEWMRKNTTLRRVNDRSRA